MESRYAKNTTLNIYLDLRAEPIFQIATVPQRIAKEAASSIDRTIAQNNGVGLRVLGNFFVDIDGRFDGRIGPTVAL